ncbi:hypothetical protein D3C80_1886900 [compost metagenome]
MARAILDVGNQVAVFLHALWLVRRQLFKQVADGLHHFNILALIVAADIVGFTYYAFGNHLVQRASVIFDV